MTGPELHVREVGKHSDGLLDSQISGPVDTDSLTAKLQREAELLRDGLSGGFSARVEHARENWGQTSLEVGGSAMLGAAITYGMKLGGKWGVLAKSAGGLFMLGMGADMVRRGTHTFGAMEETWHSQVNLEQNKQTVGQYAGSALFDYPVMLASGMAGAGTVAYGPRLATRISERLYPAEPVGGMKFNLAENGLLGAKETRIGLDPLADVRAKLELPNKKSFGLNEMGQVLEAKRIAADPQVAPIRNSMIESLRRVDELTVQIRADELALRSVEKQLSSLKEAKVELETASRLKQSVEAAKQEMAALDGPNGLRARAEALRQQLKEARQSPGETPGGKGKQEDVASSSIEHLQTKLQEVKDQIRSVEERGRGLAELERRAADAELALAQRRQAIESGTAADVTALEAKLSTARSALEGKQSELALVSQRLLQELNPQFDHASLLVPKPGADGNAPLRIPSVPEVAKPKLQIEPPKVEPPVRSTQRPGPVPPKADTVKPQPAETVRTQPAELGKGQPANRGTERPNSPRVEQKSDRHTRQEGERGAVSETRPVTEADVTRTFSDAQQAVAHFQRTHRQHTNALKAIDRYIQTSFDLMAADAKFAQNSTKLLENVNQLLAGMDRWQQGAGWFRRDELAGIMQKNNLSADQMARFNQWYESVSGRYQPKANQMAELTLAEIQQHLRNRVAVESVKHYLRMAPETATSISPIVQKGFDMMRSGKYPDGTPIPERADMIVLVKKNVNGQDVIHPFAKEGHNMQRFDLVHIVEGMRRQEVMATQGPQGFTPAELYSFRINHDPSRLIGSGPDQVGFAILRPGGKYGKNIAHMELAPGIDAAALPSNIRADAPGAHGTNTGVLINFLKSMYGQRKS